MNEIDSSSEDNYDSRVRLADITREGKCRLCSKTYSDLTNAWLIYDYQKFQVFYRHWEKEHPLELEVVKTRKKK